MMLRYLLAFILLSFVGSIAPAVEEETILKQRDINALDFQKVLAEQNLKTKLQAVVAPLFQNARYDLSVSINYKIVKGGRKTTNNEIELDKYGVVAPGISQDVLNVDLISNIGWINVKLVAYDHIPEDKVAMFPNIAKQVVDIVPGWRVRVDTVNPPAPPVVEKSNFNIWPFVVGFVLSVAAIFLGIFAFKWILSTIPAIRRQQEEPTYSNFNSARAETSQSSKSNVVYDFQQPEQPATEAEFRDLNTDEKAHVPAQAADVFDLLEQSTPESEKKVFDALFNSKNHEVLREAATAYYPSEIMFNLPPQILTAALDLMPLNDRLGLILCTEGANSSTLINCLNEKARAYMEHELEKNKANSSVKLEIRRNANRYKKDFVSFVRQVLRSNNEYARLAQPQLEEWLQRKSGGVRDVG